MFCPKCGVENPEGANVCSRCACVLSSVTATVSVSRARTSGLAIASLVLGILSFCTFLLTAPLAIIFGIISLILILKSKGQLKGLGMAIAGIAVPVVAVPIVAIMMAIMIPALAGALAGARSAAREAVCMNNLKQLDVATIMYADKNNDRYPTADKWCDLLKPYYKDDSVLRCPSTIHVICSYAMNKNLPEFVREVKNPSEMILLFESKPGWNQSGGPELLTTENHQGRGCNVAFCDGHVEFVRAEDISKLKWTEGP